MYPISNEVKALFESEQKQILRITGGVKTPIPNSVGPAAIASFDNAVAADALNVTVDITPVQSGSGDPSPENVRPISGWTGARVTRCGKNLLYLDADNIYATDKDRGDPLPGTQDGKVVIGVASNGYIRNQAVQSYTIEGSNTLQVTMINESYANAYGIGVIVSVKPDETYTINCEKTGGSIRVGWLDANGYTISYTDYITTLPVVLMPQNGAVFCMVVFIPGIGNTVTFSDIQFELGSTATDYEPYQGETYDITFPSEAGTVYGGTLDVTTGLLTVTHGYIASYNGESLPGRWISSMDVYSAGGTPTTSAQVVYELATPQTYQLTPTQIALLAGVNNVWADCGDVTVEYATGYEYEINITDANVMENGFTIDRYSCNSTKLEVGTAIASELTLKLDNRQGQFDGIVFEGAELFVEVGIADWTQDSPTVNWMPCGYFTPYLQPRKYSTITLAALDRMMRFDRVVEDGSLTLPATVAGLVAQVCALFNVTLAAAITGLPNASYSVSELPKLQQTITYRNLIQWCAGIMGTNAWMDWNGQLRFSWYDNATDYVTTAANRFSSDLHEDDITITGITYTNTQDATIVVGTDDYAIDLTGNYLAAPGIATILPTLNTALNGFTYRPFTATVVKAPYLWPMDAITFTDKDGVDHTTVLTNVNFSLNGTTAIESHGETAETNSGTAPSSVTPLQGFLIEKAKQAAIDDVDESLTQEEIFNRLTDNGAAQGLYIDPNTGQIYVNASYIRSGTLILGGLNNESGVLEVHDENDNVIGTWDKDGADITDGSITTYSQDRQQRAIVSDGIIAIQYYESAVQPIGWRDMIRLNMNSSNDAQIRANNNLYVIGYGGILNLTNKSGTTDEAYANVELNEDQAEILAKDTDVGEANIKVNPDAITFTIDDNTVNPPSIFELSNYQSDNPLSVGNGGTGANTAAAARANLGITPANIGAVTLSDVVLASGKATLGSIAAGARGSSTISFTSVGTTNYMVVLTPLIGEISCGAQNKTATSFDLYYKNTDTASARAGTIDWAIIKLP